MDQMLKKAGMDLDPIGTDDADRIEGIRKMICEGVIRSAEVLNTIIAAAKTKGLMEDAAIKADIISVRDTIQKVSATLQEYKVTYAEEKIRQLNLFQPGISLEAVTAFMMLQTTFESEIKPKLDKLTEQLCN
jgi:hypothetical protein